MNYTRGAIWIAKSFVFMWCTLQVYSLNANVWNSCRERYKLVLLCYVSDLFNERVLFILWLL